MKAIIFLLMATALATSPLFAGGAQPNSPTSKPTLEIESGSPSLYIRNARIDSRDGKIRGTAYVSFGYAAPRAAHVHFYAVSATGKILAEGCDRLTSVSLSPHPRLAGRGRDAFSADLGNLRGIKIIRLIAHSGHGC